MTFLPHLSFVFGGIRSGKSLFAEHLTDSCIGRRTYCATAQNSDEEMARRILLHRERRAPDWVLVEEPIRITECLSAKTTPGEIVLVECLNHWLSNLMLARMDIHAELDGLISATSKTSASVVLVGSEVGLGLVPTNELARQFVDWNGLMNQRIAALADQVFFVAAGLPQRLK